MATIIFLSGFILSVVIMKHNSEEGSVRIASEIFLTCTFVSAGLLGWRQATNAVRDVIQNGKTKRDVNNGVSEEPSPLPVTDP